MSPREGDPAAAPDGPDRDVEGAAGGANPGDVKDATTGGGRPPHGRTGSRSPARGHGGGSIRERVRWLWRTEYMPVMVLREVAVSVSIVLLIGALLFGVSGIWPPMVAVETGSMEPHISPNDLVFITAPDRFVHDGAVAGTGVVPYERAVDDEYVKFGGYGDVIVFMPNGNESKVPIIHRAHFYVEEGENWYDRGHPDHLGSAASCEQLANCPAPHDGFITLGDANRVYDQVLDRSSPVKNEWIIGTARVRIPYLGWIRLTLAERGIVTVMVDDVPPLNTVDVDGSAPTLRQAADTAHVADDRRASTLVDQQHTNHTSRELVSPVEAAL